MKVKIIRCFDKDWWHSKYIGQTVDVEHWSWDAYFVKKVDEHGAVLPKRDTIEIENVPHNIIKNTPSILPKCWEQLISSVDIPDSDLNPLNNR
jgi:hypothetical protein